MAAWAERRGFVTAIHERLFDASFTRQDGEPAVALCGLDNAVGRQALDQAGFDFVVEAGLGHGYRDFSDSAPAYVARSTVRCGDMEADTFSRRCWRARRLPKDAE